MADIWVFLFCVIAEGDAECEYQRETYYSYEACTERQTEYLLEHQDENFITFCRREEKLRT